MKIKTVLLSATFVLSSTLAFAQAGSGSGATVPENSGTSVNGNAAATGTVERGRMDQTTGAAVGGSRGGASAPTTPSGGSSNQGGQGQAGVAGGK